MIRKVLAGTILLACCARGPRELNVAAAISLKEALTEVAQAWEAQGGEHVVLTFAGSNVLAQKIQAGAPVDVFLSADERTAASIKDSLEARQSLLGNTLVVVSDRPLTSLSDLLVLDRVAIGDPTAVPAGVYARQALQRAGMYEMIEPKLVPCENVRAALAAVESGSADAAFVYATDARLAKRTKIAFALQEQVTYPIAVVKGSKHAKAARRFVEYCQSDDAMRIFIARGFRPAFSRSADTTSIPPAR